MKSGVPLFVKRLENTSQGSTGVQNLGTGVDTDTPGMWYGQSPEKRTVWCRGTDASSETGSSWDSQAEGTFPLDRSLCIMHSKIIRDWTCCHVLDDTEKIKLYLSPTAGIIEMKVRMGTGLTSRELKIANTLIVTPKGAARWLPAGGPCKTLSGKSGWSTCLFGSPMPRACGESVGWSRFLQAGRRGENSSLFQRCFLFLLQLSTGSGCTVELALFLHL